jgi:hypothetical protein
MRRAAVVLALPAIVLTGCVAPESIDFDLACRARTVTLNHVRHASISVTNPVIDVCRGETIGIRVVPPVDPNRARSSPGPENPSATWLDRESMDGRRIDILVPPPDAEDAPEVGEELKYTLTIDGVGTLDPTIRIIR